MIGEHYNKYTIAFSLIVLLFVKFMFYTNTYKNYIATYSNPIVYGELLFIILSISLHLWRYFQN